MMLFLTELSLDTVPSQSEIDQVETVLSSLQKALTTLLIADRSNQKEAKAWLLNAIAGLGLQDPGLKRRKFGQYLPGGSAYDRQHEEYGRQLLQGLFTDEPQKVARLVASEPSVLKRFFRQDAAHIRLWFGHFSMSGMADFKHGAYALARYALLHRDEVWRLLVWGGKHPQAPVAVAQKTHYFCELDVPATVNRLLEECPQFWESEELRSSLASGQALALAPSFWAQELYGWLKEYSPRSDRLFGLVCDYLETGADWRQLCSRLLPLLAPADLLSFATGLLDGLPPPPPPPGAPPAAAEPPPPSQVSAGAAPKDSGGSGQGLGSAGGAGAGRSPGGPVPSGAWLVFRGEGRWGSLEQLAAGAAVGCSLRQLGRLAREEENAEELQDMLGLAEQLEECEAPAVHWHLRWRLADQARQAQRAQQAQQLPAASPPAEPSREEAAKKGCQGSGDTQRKQSRPPSMPPADTRPTAAAGAGGPGLGILSFLLLHLWAAYLKLYSLASAISGESSSGSSGGALEQFEQVVQQAGVVCWQGEPAAGEDNPEGWGAAEPVTFAGGGSQRAQDRKRQRRERAERWKSKGNGKKKRRHHRSRSRSREWGRKQRRSEDGGDAGRRKWRRRGSSGESSDGGSSSGGSSSGGLGGGSRERHGSLGGGMGAPGLGEPGASGRGCSVWVLQLPGGAQVSMSCIEVVDYVMDRVALSYAAWLASQNVM